ncbi:MAG: zinc metalloprotease HtpX [Chloroflexi bacterium AL-W]|nr:zinc metalloprotease HtpX [Chloroflexi bacterium AL-N1]NOK69459.1 zinc metalloprotease HtpX [Chloroflexi bacterium AL-N10]NOK77424.1 zinc metalloprotease HtpX [Chloroflexi bacterium AL-N5]NOK84275.1 zinc metalloprotease HtpX [Chloroflexi bacterium AL-W]NOK91560.1 zinc metalloprotease HtpX [Chloroflexi bacterium AL-N15]
MNIFNSIKTTALLAGLMALMVFVGQLLGGTGGMIIAFIFALLMNGGAYWFSDKLALRMSGAQEVTPEEAPELHGMVADLSQRANLPMPRVYIIQSEAPNAFATGRNPQNAAVAATTGIMQILDREELAGVMAHELAHIKNRDTLISAIAATIAGTITFLANMAQWALIFGGLGGSDEDDGGIAGLVGGILMIILAPIAAVIIQMAISRAREYSADAVGAQIVGNPIALASALRKLESWIHKRPMAVDPSTAHMYIVNPLSGSTIAGLFSTHPPMQERVSRLEQLAMQRQTAM